MVVSGDGKSGEWGVVIEWVKSWNDEKVPMVKITQHECT